LAFVVERRRRETINEGINELAKIVPGCEKNKGSILQRAVQYIQQLKENETQNIEKWTLEKLLTEQAIQQLSQCMARSRNLEEELPSSGCDKGKWGPRRRILMTPGNILSSHNQGLSESGRNSIVVGKKPSRMVVRMA
jgi:hypothetical protein